MAHRHVTASQVVGCLDVEGFACWSVGIAGFPTKAFDADTVHCATYLLAQRLCERLQGMKRQSNIAVITVRKSFSPVSTKTRKLSGRFGSFALQKPV
jgi:gamma-glutamylcyclotransferase (GGCT)/AIG2-like uncharacterized protein YtfP